MKYRVHLYLTYRLPVEVEAGSQREAIAAAEKAADPRAYDRSDDFCYAEEVTAALVDEECDEEYERTRLWEIDSNGDWQERKP